MPRLIQTPSIIQAAGTKPKRIEEFVGRVNSGHGAMSIARVTSPLRVPTPNVVFQRTAVGAECTIGRRPLKR